MFFFSNFTFLNSDPHNCRFRAGLTFSKKLKHFSMGKSFIKTSKNREIRETFSSLNFSPVNYYERNKYMLP